MSNIPDSIRAKGGYKTSRDTRPSSQKNIRLKCPYCPRDNLLFTSYGPHIFKEHQELMFLADNKDAKDNRDLLFKKKSLKEPLLLSTPKGFVSWCFGCQSCFQNNKKAESHLSKWKDCQRIHEENIYTLREAFPLTAPPAPTILKKKQQLNSFLDDLLEHLRHAETLAKIEPWNFKEDYGQYFEDWNLELDEEELRKTWRVVLDKPQEPTPSVPPERDGNMEESKEELMDKEVIEQPLEESEEKVEPEEEDLLPLVTTKGPTKIDLLKQLLADPEISEEDKKYLNKDLETELKKNLMPTAPPSSHYSIPKPRQEPFLFKQQAPAPAFPSVKIIQSTKRPSPSGPL
jgi:hypothetical protein